MNLLKCTISKIISETPVWNKYMNDFNIQVHAIIDIDFVGEREIDRLFLTKDWEEAKKKGWYWG